MQTILHLHNIEIPKQMDGKVIYELLNEKAPASAPVRAETKSLEAVAYIPGGKYRLILEQSVLGENIYLNSAKVIRGE